MKVCYWGTFERQYPRNSVLISGLRQNGVEVIECHFPLWRGGLRYNKLALLSGWTGKLRILGRALRAYPSLLARYLLLREHDAVVVGYLGHIDILFLAPAARLRRKPIIFDAFFSLYDTAVSDWGLVADRCLLARLFLFLDRIACKQATLVVVDTHAQKEYFCHKLGVPEKKVRCVYVGADDSVFVPAPEEPCAKPLRVLYVGNYVPLHGVSTILQAARLLERQDIEFWMIGDYQAILKPNAHVSLSFSSRVRFYEWMPLGDLRNRIAEADICLGIFGTSAKAKHVIPGKAFLALAMGKPLITGDSPAARELLEDGKNAVLCELGDPHALAEAIVRVQGDPLLRRRIAEEGRRLFERQLTPRALGSLLASFIREIAARG